MLLLIRKIRCFCDRADFGIGFGDQGHAIKECFVNLPLHVVKLVTGLSKPADPLDLVGSKLSSIRLVDRLRPKTATSWNLR
jgi:hypothetical protein